MTHKQNRKKIREKWMRKQTMKKVKEVKVEVEEEKK